MDKQEEKQVQGYEQRLLDDTVQPKISKLAIVSLLLGIFSLFFFVLAGIPAIVIGVIGTFRIRRSAGKLKGKYIALAGMNISILLMIVFYLLWSIDAPPIPDDYTIADLRSAPPEYAESFEILKTLLGEETDSSGVSAIEITKSDSSMIAEVRGIIKTGTTSEITKAFNYCEEEIKQIWADNKVARDVIRRLNEFPEIADLTSPSIDFKIMQLQDLLQLAYLYEVYSHLQTEQDDIHAVTVQLIELDSVFRKLSLNARPLFSKLVCYFCMTADMVTANSIANNALASQESVEMLAGHFTPLTKEQLSLRNSVLFEYLINGNIGQSKVGKIPLLKRNSTLRLYRNVFDGWINAMEGVEDPNFVKFPVWPSIYQRMGPVSLQASKSLPLLYICYNPVGAHLVRLRFVSYKSLLKQKAVIQVHNDLLQIVLNKRLGKDFSLKARAYSDEYIVDVENRKIFSPGPDGKEDTKEDIILRINPDVLGWRN